MKRTKFIHLKISTFHLAVFSCNLWVAYFDQSHIRLIFYLYLLCCNNVLQRPNTFWQTLFQCCLDHFRNYRNLMIWNDRRQHASNNLLKIIQILQSVFFCFLFSFWFWFFQFETFVHRNYFRFYCYYHNFSLFCFINWLMFKKQFSLQFIENQSYPLIGPSLKCISTVYR